MPPTAVEKTYWAFISYSSKDNQRGQWLHRRLENYPIPPDFQGQALFDGAVLGRNLRPVFRDRDELSGSADLGQAIHRALEASRFLVVLCSRHSAKSEWVDKEIADFKAMGKGDHILALILDGEPNATAKGRPGDECFPPSLRYPEEPIAGDLRPDGDGPERGFLKVLAGITQLDFDRLYRRHERSQARRRLVLALTASALLAVFASLAGIAWWQGHEADLQRQAAVSARDEAEANRRLAVENQGKAEVNWKAAETNLALAEAQKVQTELRRLEAVASQRKAVEAEGVSRRRLADLFLEEARRELTARNVESVSLLVGAAQATAPDHGELPFYLAATAHLWGGGSRSFQVPQKAIQRLTAFGDGFATGGIDGRLLVWDGGGRISYDGVPAPSMVTALAAQGNRLAVGFEDGTVAFLDRGTPALVPVVLPGHTGAVRGFVFLSGDPPGAVLSYGLDGQALVWDPAAGKPVGSALEKQVLRNAAAVEGTGAVIFQAIDGALTLWQPGTKAPVPLEGAPARPDALLVPVSDGLLVVAPGKAARVAGGPGSGNLPGVRAFDLPAFVPVQGCRGAPGTALVLASDGRLFRIDGAGATALTVPSLKSLVSSPDGLTAGAEQSDRSLAVLDTAAGTLRVRHLPPYAGTLRLQAGDDRRLAVLADDGRVTVFGADLASGSVWAPGPGPAAPVQTLLPLGSGALLVTGWDNTARVLDPSGKERARWTLEGPAGGRVRASLHPNGRDFVLWSPGEVQVRRRDDLGLSARLPPPAGGQDYTFAAGYGPAGLVWALGDRNVLASVTDSDQVWTAQDYRKAGKLLVGKRRILDAAGDPLGKYWFLLDHRGTARAYSLDTGDDRNLSSSFVTALSYDPDARVFLLGKADGRLEKYSLDLRRLWTTAATGFPVTCLASGYGKVLTGDPSGWFRQWSPAGAASGQFRASGSALRQLSLLDAGHLLVLDEAGQVHLAGLGDGLILWSSPPGEADPPVTLTPGADGGAVLAGTRSGAVRSLGVRASGRPGYLDSEGASALDPGTLVNPVTQSAWRTLGAGGSGGRAAAAAGPPVPGLAALGTIPGTDSNNLRLGARSGDPSGGLSVGGDGKVVLFSAGRPLRVIRVFDFPLFGVSSSPDGAVAAVSGNSEEITLLEAGSGRVLRTLTGHRGRIADVAFHPRLPLLASASRDGSARLWDPATGRLVKELGDFRAYVNRVEFLVPASALAARTQDRSAARVYFWEEDLDLDLGALVEPGDGVSALACSADGKRFFLGTEGGRLLTFVRQGRAFRTIGKADLGGEVGGISPLDGSTLAVTVGDGLRILREGAVSATWAPHPDGGLLGWVALEDGTLVTAGAGDRTVRAWDRAGRLRGQLVLETPVRGLTLGSDRREVFFQDGAKGVFRWDPASARPLETSSESVLAVDGAGWKLVQGPGAGGGRTLRVPPDAGPVLQAGELAGARGFWWQDAGGFGQVRKDAPGRPLRTKASGQGPSSSDLPAVLAGPDGLLAVLDPPGQGGTLRIYDLDAGTERLSRDASGGRWYLTPQGPCRWAGTTLEVWDWAGNRTSVLGAPGGIYDVFGGGPSGALWVADRDGFLVPWSLGTGEPAPGARLDLGGRPVRRADLGGGRVLLGLDTGGTALLDGVGRSLTALPAVSGFDDAGPAGAGRIWTRAGWTFRIFGPEAAGPRWEWPWYDTGARLAADTDGTLRLFGTRGMVLLGKAVP